jgi:hypothetical protein
VVVFLDECRARVVDEECSRAGCVVGGAHLLATDEAAELNCPGREVELHAHHAAGVEARQAFLPAGLADLPTTPRRITRPPTS